MKTAYLGTALWGWTVDEALCEETALLFTSEYPALFDAAANYPLNGDGVSFRKSMRMLSRIYAKRKFESFCVLCKIGSLSNTRAPEHDLTPENILKECEICADLFGSAFKLMVHWDNRSDASEISKTIEALLKVSGGKYLGLSGIKYPSAYATALRENFGGINPEIQIELKHNFALSDIPHYAPLEEFQPSYLSYGICAGGIRLDKNSYGANSYVAVARGEGYHDSVLTAELEGKIESEINADKRIVTLYDYAVKFQENSPKISSYIIAPSTPEQMRGILEFRKKLGGAPL